MSKQQASNAIILKVAVAIPKHNLFDYLPPEDFDQHKQSMPVAGSRVLVPFRNRLVVAILITHQSHSDYSSTALKRAVRFMDDNPAVPAIDPAILHLAQRLHKHYQHSLGEILHAALPTALRKDKAPSTRTQKNKTDEAVQISTPISSNKHTDIVLNADQATAVQKILESNLKLESKAKPQTKLWRPFLLYGPTASGKTDVYLRLTQHMLQNKKQILVLVPEIGMTPQITEHFEKYFPNQVDNIHSKIIPAKRYKVWQQAKDGRLPIVIGTRSAVFTPMPDLGLIIIDEEHDPSFKQEQNRFKYMARDVAIMRAQDLKIPIVLGSATPSLESINNSDKAKFQRLTLSKRISAQPKPQWHIADIRGQKLTHGISSSLLSTISQHINAANQVLLFLNRRGYASAWACEQCEWIQECPHCSAYLVVHRRPTHLLCHHCQHQQPLFSHCPQCAARAMKTIGIGTQQCEQYLSRLYPTTPIYRIDRDNMRNIQQIKKLFHEIKSGQPCILIGTQVLSKGHHFPDITLTAVLDADTSLYAPDFRSSERFAQMITQVAGRCGRWQKPGEIVIQTRHPDEPVFSFLTRGDYLGFAKTLLKQRQQRSLPPFVYAAVLNYKSTSAQDAEQKLNAALQILNNFDSGECSVIGPLPSLIPLYRGLHHRHLVIYAKNYATRHKTIEALCNYMQENSSNLHWSIDIDPL